MHMKPCLQGDSTPALESCSTVAPLQEATMIKQDVACCECGVAIAYGIVEEGKCVCSRCRTPNILLGAGTGHYQEDCDPTFENSVRFCEDQTE